MKNHLMRAWKRWLWSQTTVDIALKVALNRVLAEAYAAGRIKTIYDIGAHKGRWSLEMRDLMPQARFILFEANPRHEADLAATDLQYYISVLTRPGPAQVDFYSRTDDKGSTGGSIYKEITPQYGNVTPVSLSAITLAELCRAEKLPQPDFIKIDTQGSELDIVEGGLEIFSRANYVLMEMSILQYNDGAPSFDQYVSRLKEIGFLPVALAEVHKYGPIVHQLDFLFASRRLIDKQTLAGLNV